MRPSQICVIFWILIALLGGLCAIAPEGGWQIGSLHLRWPTLAEALDLHEKTAETAPDAIDDIDMATTETDEPTTAEPTSESETTAPAPVVSPKPQPVEDNQPQPANTIDTRRYLAAFYDALAEADSKQVRVVHYGDSQIEEDRITMVLREQLQTAYGGGGVGLIPLHQTIPTRTTRQVLQMSGQRQSTQGGPKRYLAYGPKSMRREDGDYGVMGQVAMLNDSLKAGSEQVLLSIEPMENRHTYNYFNQIRLLAEGVEGRVCLRRDTIAIPSSGIVALPDSTTRCSIDLIGKGKVYGISLETKRGVIVDNIAMRGCLGTMFTQMDATELKTFFAETNTRLIIMQFGGNMIPNTEKESTIIGYVKSLRNQVQYIKQCAPDAALLFIGPSDMSTRIDGEMTTYPLVPYMDRLLAKMANEEEIAYWSLYQAMGGYNSMLRWQERGLAGSDYVHFTRKGAKKVGQMLWEYISAPIEERNAAQAIDNQDIATSAEADAPAQTDTTQTQQ